MVRGGRQVLLCPSCQHDDPGWMERADRCAACGSTRLSMMLGMVVCRACGADYETGPGEPSDF